MKKYRKKPVVIEAAQWNGETIADVEKFCKEHNLPLSKFTVGYRGNMAGMIVHTLEGDMVAQRGDYIVKGIRGEFYPVKPDIFEKTYEEVENASDEMIRAKRMDNNEWVYGQLLGSNFIVIDVRLLGKTIAFTRYEVILETVGRNIGRKDINSNTLYQHDIVKAEYVDSLGYSAGEIIGVIQYAPEWAMYVVSDGPTLYSFRYLREVEKIGNKFDNPELLRSE